MKKMTIKEFKAALEAGGISLESWGWEGILNMIICQTRHAADELANVGFFSAAASEHNSAHVMHMILEDRGYYGEKTTA